MEPNIDAERPARVKVLIENYRESRQEGINLVHSSFNDTAFTVALLGSIITGGFLANEPRLLLFLPFLIGGIAIYAIQKWRVNNLITCYMIYLEKEINKEYENSVMIWNSELIRKNVSTGRQSIWGHAMLVFLTIVLGALYAGICYWPIFQNQTLFAQGQNQMWFYVYILACVAIFIFNIVGIIGVLTITKKYSPDYIEKLVKCRQVSYSTPKKLNKLNK